MRQIHLQNLKTGNEYDFIYDDWIKCTTEQDGWTEVPLEDDPESKLPGNNFNSLKFGILVKNATAELNQYE